MQSFRREFLGVCRFVSLSPYYRFAVYRFRRPSLKMPSLNWAKEWNTMIKEKDREVVGSLGDESFDPGIAVAVAPIGVRALSHTIC